MAAGEKRASSRRLSGRSLTRGGAISARLAELCEIGSGGEVCGARRTKNWVLAAAAAAAAAARRPALHPPALAGWPTHPLPAPTLLLYMLRRTRLC